MAKNNGSTTKPAKQSRSSAPPDEKKVVPKQLALMEDIAGQSLQRRFEDFCEAARESLTITNDHGEPIFDAGEAAAELTIKIKVARLANDSLNLSFDHSISEKHPKVPGKLSSAMYVRNVGYAQRVDLKQHPLFDPADGQPTPIEIEAAQRTLANCDHNGEEIDTKGQDD